MSLKPKSCPRHFKRPNHKSSEFSVRKGSLKGPTENMGDLMAPPVQPAHWTWLKAFRVCGDRYVEGRQDQFRWQDRGTWPFVVKGRQHWIFVEKGPLASERFQCSTSSWLHPGPLHLWGERGRDFGPRCSWRSHFSPGHVPGPLTCGFDTKRQLSVSFNGIEPF